MRSTKFVVRSTTDFSQFSDSDKVVFRWLEDHYHLFNTASFIEEDPVSVPHRFSLLQDIEIAGFFTAIMAWGNRTTIIRKSLELMQRMPISIGPPAAASIASFFPAGEPPSRD